MRKKINDKVIKAIFSKSGNVCAFPGCKENLVNEDYKVMCEIAHIEALSKNGPRFNPNQTDEERNSASNLMCLCRNHHFEIDAYPNKYTIEILKKIKSDHEKKYNGTYSFDYERIFEVNKELKLFMDEMQDINNKNDDCLKRIIKINADFKKSILIINNDIKNLESISNDISNYLENLNENIIKTLKKNNIDRNKWKNGIDEFILPFWEECSLGIPNNLNDIKIHIVHLEILYYSEVIKISNDKNIKKQLEKAKRTYKKYCKEAFVYD